MTQLTDNIWIGDSSVSWRDVRASKIDGVLNVAQDLRGIMGWPDVEYMQVGLIDGPGNPATSYCAAALALSALIGRHKRILVCCHTGSRSMAVVMMYLNIAAGHSWDGLLALLRERVDADLPIPNAAHRAAFDGMDWRLLASI